MEVSGFSSRQWGEMKPFKGAKREVGSLNKEFHGKCIIASSANAWMNAELTNQWVENVLGSFSFSRRLLSWDTHINVI